MTLLHALSHNPAARVPPPPSRGGITNPGRKGSRRGTRCPRSISPRSSSIAFMTGCCRSRPAVSQRSGFPAPRRSSYLAQSTSRGSETPPRYGPPRSRRRPRRRDRAPRRRHRRVRRPHIGAHHGNGRGRRGARVTHGARPDRRFGTAIHGPRHPLPQGSSRGSAAIRARLIQRGDRDTSRPSPCADTS